ncbi:P-loop containing nucleoside triphosphate hydrolase protein [Basidiobolus meristosporus CBS 931.73]|uniref:p-loop containing nucleoside triphosphate hydrolase protein n=1 Tax=Basidiobolus meristosporus CBS 931.73 TaxID=1314790 RepID=A0A1Y1XSE8_9FUNG|nr:P-loop containing nucleoside triphosphate hydrolase protein [Basidiobolus meristosporus CBS 931.73]|eukprot:ORX88605.1 P-loop containing nucleoside triphosphate hydrolase protein [Basidiobolus meristosporus CBS 931.73]
MTRTEEYYVIILGLDNAGKTTLLEKIKNVFTGSRGLAPEKIAPTVGLNIGKIVIGKTRVNFWDLGGQRDLRTLWEKYYKECHGIVFVVDSTDSSRLQECREAFESMVAHDSTEGVPVIMLANKQDLPNALKVEEIKEIFNKIALSLDARDSKVMPISALNGEGVKEAIDWLHFRLERNVENRPPVLR